MENSECRGENSKSGGELGGGESWSGEGAREWPEEAESDAESQVALASSVFSFFQKSGEEENRERGAAENRESSENFCGVGLRKKSSQESEECGEAEIAEVEGVVAEVGASDLDEGGGEEGEKYFVGEGAGENQEQSERENAAQKFRSKIGSGNFLEIFPGFLGENLGDFCEKVLEFFLKFFERNFGKSFLGIFVEILWGFWGEKNSVFSGKTLGRIFLKVFWDFFCGFSVVGVSREKFQEILEKVFGGVFGGTFWRFFWGFWGEKVWEKWREIVVEDGENRDDLSSAEWAVGVVVVAARSQDFGSEIWKICAGVRAVGEELAETASARAEKKN